MHYPLTLKIMDPGIRENPMEFINVRIPDIIFWSWYSGNKSILRFVIIA